MSDVKIQVKPNGPLLVSGDISLVDIAGKAFGLGSRTTIALCRCGHSENKPFCDGAHNRAGFQSDTPARDLPPPAPRV
jgi:CDGSH-type Zn-finger protein